MLVYKTHSFPLRSLNPGVGALQRAFARQPCECLFSAYQFARAHVAVPGRHETMSTCRAHMQVSSEAVARQLRVNRGAVIQAVAPNSAAAKAGLLPTRRALSGIVAGDTIVRIDSKPVAKPGKSHRCHAKSQTQKALLCVLMHAVGKWESLLSCVNVDCGSKECTLRRGPSPGIG